MFPKNSLHLPLGQVAMHLWLQGLDECSRSSIFKRTPQMPPHTVVDPIIFPKSFPLSEFILLPCDFVVSPTQRAECTS